MAIKARLHESHIMSGDAYDDFIESLCADIPPCWDDDAAVEAIIEQFVKWIIPAATAAGATHKEWCTGNC